MSVLVDLALDERYCPQCERSFVTDEPVCPDDGTRLVSLAPPDPLIGRAIDDRYTIVERIAVGGMGAVYRARQHSVEREVALKVVRPGLGSDPDTIKRFLREAKLASQLAHPNTVGVLDFGQTGDGMFYLVMELIEGRTLDEVLRRDGVFDARRLVRIGVQICDALEAAHAMSIVHRDLKPSNILLLDHTRDLVKVVDFGLAKSLEADASMTRTGAMCGTPAYLAPERACGRAGDHRSDLYALGCVLFLLGSGRLPFVSAVVPELLRMQVAEPAPPMTGVPAALADVVDRLLLKEPAQRFQSASALRDALEEALPGTGPVTIVPRRWRRPPTVRGPVTIASVPVAPAALPSPPALARRSRATTLVTRVRRQPWWIAGVLTLLAGATDGARPAGPARTALPASSIAAPRPISGHVGPPLLLEAHVDAPARREPVRQRRRAPAAARRAARLPF